MWNAIWSRVFRNSRKTERGTGSCFASVVVRAASFALVTAGLALSATVSGTRVTLVRVPDGGIQPQVAVDTRGIVHLLYFRGEAGGGDLYYVRSSDGGATFSRPIRVNSQPESAIATGNIRGAHLAIGRNGKVHVAWNGSNKAEPRGPDNATPMLYTRLNDAGTAFEPQRNVIQSAYRLDGGGAVAADAAGNVYVFWHAPAPGTQGEASRRVWVARSSDDGKTFARERAAFDEPTGACGCCGMAALADSKGNVYALYRSAREMVHRDMYLLFSHDRGASFSGSDVSAWNVGFCVMSLASFAEGPAGVEAAWETGRQVYFATVDSGKAGAAVGAPGAADDRRYPALAINSRGDTLLAWTEGMGWKKGGSAAWQVFDAKGRPEGNRGEAEGVPAWSLVAAYARPDGGFAVVY
ncbi:MAG: sialidase family protein [Bryobacteraceae bacterium]